jgi:hypothetical protein
MQSAAPDQACQLRECPERRVAALAALTVDQEPFATDARRALHEQGWNESFDRLAELIGNRDWP